VFESHIWFKNQRITVAASLGVARFGDNEPLQNVMRRADEALYVAKDTGRNRVMLAAEPANAAPSLVPLEADVARFSAIKQREALQ
jgi:predicted signal transduction protein with EAL and GGDEF domain